LKLTTHFHLVSGSRMRGAIPPLPNMLSWRAAQSSTGTTSHLPYLIMKSPPASCNLHPLCSKYYFRHLVLEHLQACVLFLGYETKFHARTNQQINIYTLLFTCLDGISEDKIFLNEWWLTFFRI